MNKKLYSFYFSIFIKPLKNSRKYIFPPQILFDLLTKHQKALLLKLVKLQFYFWKSQNKMGSVLFAFIIGSSMGALGVHMLDDYGNERLIGAVLGCIIIYAIVKGMIS